MKKLLVMLFALHLVSVHGFAGMTADQEIYNNITFYVALLSAEPSAADYVKKELQEFDQTKLTSDTITMINALSAKCTDVAMVQRQIEYIVTDGDKAIANRSVTDGIEGGLAAAGTIAKLDYASDGEINGGAVAYALVGLAGGLIKHMVESGKVQDQVQRAITEEQLKQADILAQFAQDVNKYRQKATYQQFDRALLFQPAIVDALPKDTSENYLAAAKRDGIFKYRVALLNTLIAQYAVENVPDPKWVDAADALVKEWPSCKDKNHPTCSWALGNLAYAALLERDMKRAEDLATEALARLPSNHNALNNRAIARMRQGRGDEALNDIDRAISVNPKHSWYLYSKARIYTLALKDRTKAIEAINQAFALGFCDIKRLQTDPELALLHEDQRFIDATTVKWEWNVSNGIFYSDVYVKNKSPFALTSVRVASGTSGWNPDLRTTVIRPGETYHWGWIDQPPQGYHLNASLSCDQAGP